MHSTPPYVKFRDDNNVNLVNDNKFQITLTGGSVSNFATINTGSDPNGNLDQFVFGGEEGKQKIQIDVLDNNNNSLLVGGPKTCM